MLSYTYRQLSSERLKTLLDPQTDLFQRWALINLINNSQNQYHPLLQSIVQSLSKSIQYSEQVPPVLLPLPSEELKIYERKLTREPKTHIIEYLLDDKFDSDIRLRLARTFTDLSLMYDSVLVEVSHIILSQLEDLPINTDLSISFTSL